jgi:ATP-binding cassette subfamily C protein CydCD
MFDANLWREALSNRRLLILTVAFSALGGAATITQAFFLSRIVDGVFLQSKANVSDLLLALAGAILVRALLAAGGETAAHRLASGLMHDLRERLLAHLAALGPAQVDDERTGEVTAVLTSGVDSLEAYFSQYLPQLFSATLIPLAIFAVVLPADWPSALILIVTAPLIPLFMILIGRFADNLTQRQWRSLSLMSAHFLDVLQGLTTLKILGQSRQQAQNIARITEQYREATMGVLRIAFLSALVLELLSTLSVAIVAVAIGLRLLYGTMAFVDALFVLILAPEFYLPLRLLGQRFHAGMNGVAAAERIFAVLGLKIEDLRFKIGESQSLHNATIELQNVSYAYQEGRRPALHDVSLRIGPGEKVALVGASGAGKSTIASLLLGFIVPDNGRIVVTKENGTRISRINTDKEKSVSISVHQCPDNKAVTNWRGQIAWVSQNPALFYDTIAANIRLGRPEASQEEVIIAAKAAQAHDFITVLPQGYDTLIGEQGARLSGGQAQRLALARAFLQDAPFLILDEPTAHLDPQTEADLQTATEALLHGRSALIIAHRLQTITQADKIVVLENGRVVQTGTHEELIRQEGVYQKLMGEHPASSVIRHPSSVNRQSSIVNRQSSISNLQSPVSNLQSPIRHLLTLLQPYKSRIALAVLLGALTIGSSVSLLATSAYLISAAALQPSIAELSVAIVGVRFFGLSRGVFRYLERLVSHGVTFRLLARLRVWFYQALEPLAPARLQQFRSGDLLARIVADIETLEDFYIRVVAPPLVAVVVAVGVGVWTAVYNPLLALTLLFFLILAGVGLPLLIWQLSEKPGKAVIVHRADLHVRLVEMVQGLADLTVLGQNGRFQSRIEQISRQLTAAQNRMAAISGLHAGLSTLLSNGGMAAVLALAIPLVVQGQIDGVYLAGLALAALAAFEATQPLPQAAQQLTGSRQAISRLLEIVTVPPAVSEPIQSRVHSKTSLDFEKLETGDWRQGVSSTSASLSTSLKSPVSESNEKVDNERTLTVRHLSFSYEDGPPVLADVSFDLPPGKRLAIVGPSGAGKTTLLNLLLRFWEFDQGEIMLDGRSLTSYPSDGVRRCFGVIHQNTYLFNGSVRDNLRLANPQADQSAIEAAARQAQIHEFIASLPEGYETAVGELGRQLSGGQRQRLAIARALLRDAPILLLDEPTANLDALTAGQILGTITAVSANRSLLLITHQLSGLEGMDEIVVLENGRVVERGQHQQLIDQQGLYYRLWSLQNQILETK